MTSAALVRAALPGRTPLAPARPRRPAAARPRRARGRGRPAAGDRRRSPSSSTTILLAIDVSGSMCSTDVQPNRLTAAQKAATDFIKAQPGGARIGLVAFAGIAGVLVPPTDDTDALLAALNEPHDLPRHRHRPGDPHLDRRASPTSTRRCRRPGSTSPAARRSGYAADVIVVLTDGANTQGVDPQTAAKQAAARRRAGLHDRLRHHHAGADGLRRSQIGDAPGGGGPVRRRRRRVRRRRSAGATRWSPTTPPSGRSPRPPAASTTGRRTPASCRTPWPTCRARSPSRTSTSTSPPGSPASAAADRGRGRAVALVEPRPARAGRAPGRRLTGRRLTGRGLTGRGLGGPLTSRSGR